MKAVGSLVMTALAAQTAADHLTVGDAKWTAPTSMDKYVKLLHKDTDAFVADVAAWVSRVADDKIETDASFAVRTDGREWSESCGDLSAHKAFHVLESFVDAPASAALSLKQATPLEWRPEDDCVAQRDFESLDGGSHAEFSVHCGKERLVHAISGGSGFYAPRGRHGDKYVGGAKAAVVVGDDIELSGVLYAGKRFKGKMETFHVPKHADKVVDDLHKAIRRCARDGDLVVSGVVGGGWTQRYTNKKGKHVKSEAKPTKEVKPTEVVETTKAPHAPSKGVSVDKSVLVAANATSSAPSNATHVVLPSNATAPVATTLAVVNTTSAINTTTLTNASSAGSADGFAAITASLSDLSAHISLAYYEAGLECATRESDSVCQSARVAAKLNTKLVSLNAYETLDMSAVYGNRLTTSWGPSSFDAMAVAAVGAVCVTAFVALRTQQRRAGYMGIPQQDAAAAPTSTWPSYV
ncbi:hypothetical protein SDRG_07885 [Saprolegnia diclina VS20]|uniref:Uncharacterized protein n=1 Tax=Saprolegnia diclina (strain VS20) TaxID=1156394 RepID=T0QL84_SAPDV|nr:hypothetical protein SDRG_07885 [Saprolegnia diclina VS20]EQC34560.1 hypothetical protein SDRG_07885 [Saprolegnia diclina VS20]|eukprot:XP_008611966.1 hypothetical protein SDRG_07885 [Saprolegnia diclina VS20]